MSLETHLFQMLSTNEGLRALIADRIYPGKLPPNVVYPAVIYRVLGGPDFTTFEGIDPARDSRIEFNVVAQTYIQVIAVKKALIKAFKSYVQTVGDSTIGGAQLAMDVDDTWSETTTLFRRIVAFDVIHEEHD